MTKWSAPCLRFFLIVFSIVLDFSFAISSHADTPADLFQARRGISVAPLVAVDLARDGDSDISIYRAPPTAEDGLDRDLPERLRATGFELVRLVVNPLPMLDNPPAARRRAVERVLATVDRFAEAGLATILDLHFWVPPDALDTALDDEAGRRRYRRMVGELAAALATRPHGRTALELLNEPPATACETGRPFDWNTLQPALIAEVRAVAPELPLVVTGCVGRIDMLLALGNGIDFADPNLVYTLHFYHPFAYTHQYPYYGITCWCLDYPADPELPLHAYTEGALWRDTAQQRQAMNDIGRYIGQSRAAVQAEIDAALRSVADWAAARRIPPGRVFVGEYGAVIGPRPPDESPRAGQLRWLADVQAAIDRYGFSAAYWAYPRPQGFDASPATGFLRRDVLRAIGIEPRR